MILTDRHLILANADTDRVSTITSWILENIFANIFLMSRFHLQNMGKL